MNNHLTKFLKVFLASLVGLVLFGSGTFIYGGVATLMISFIGSTLSPLAGLISALLFILIYIALIVAISSIISEYLF